MDLSFQEFVSSISAKLSNPLPGEQSQLIMAPYNRSRKEEALAKDPSPRKSAVLVLFFHKRSEPHVLLMKRSSYNGTHSAQVSFPGGKVEKTDTDHFHTALREANEEVGVEQSSVEIIGELSELYIPPSRFLVNPVIGIYQNKPTWQLNPREVQEVIELPLSLLLDDSCCKNGEVLASSINQKIKAPYFDVYGHRVWGATAMMLSELKYIINAY